MRKMIKGHIKDYYFRTTEALAIGAKCVELIPDSAKTGLSARATNWAWHGLVGVDTVGEVFKEGDICMKVVDEDDMNKILSEKEAGVNLLKEIIKLQKDYNEIVEKGGNDENITALVTPFKEKHDLTLEEAFDIAIDRLSIEGIVKVLTEPTV